MRSAILICACALVALASSVAVYPQMRPPVEEKTGDVRLPNGRLQRDAILKADYERNLDDAAELSKLADEVKISLEKNTQYVLSIDDMKKLQQIEKLAKKIRSRMKRL
jgi:hypothetical protein